MTEPVNTNKRLRVCMIVPDPMVEGGIAAVTAGYYGSRLEQVCDVTYVQSYRNGSKWDKLAKALSAYREYRHLLRTQTFDVVHIHSSFGPSFYRKTPFILWAARRGIPVVNHIHGAEFGPFYADASERNRALVRKVYGKCARFIVLSQEWQARIAQIVPAERITVVPNYSAPIAECTAQALWAARTDCARQGTSDGAGDDVSAVPQHDAASVPHGPQVLFLGEIGQRKGAYDLPAVIRGVRAVMPEVRFVIAGSGDIDGVHGMLDPADVDAVQFPGWVRGDDKARLLRESSLYILPSYNEGLPMSVLDAMGYALPIVSTTVGGIPQLVTCGNGELATPGDTKTMADAIVSILGTPGRAQEYGMQSLAIVNAHYSLDAHIDALVQVYRLATLGGNP